jgi:hypothetical protein
MKIKTKITDITHDDLVNLLSTSLYGSHLLGADYNVEDYKSLDNVSENDSFEDKMAKILLAGKSIILADMYAEDADDFYGKLPHRWDEENLTMDYEVTLNDIVKGIEKALNNGGWDAECAMNLINADDGDLDQPQAENLCQIIMFGTAVYG